MIFSIVKSNYEKLVIERIFIEEFLPEQSIEISLGFTNFKSSLDFLVEDHERGFASKSSLEIELKGLDDKELLENI